MYAHTYTQILSFATWLTETSPKLRLLHERASISKGTFNFALCYFSLVKGNNTENWTSSWRSHEFWRDPLFCILKHCKYVYRKAYKKYHLLGENCKLQKDHLRQRTYSFPTSNLITRCLKKLSVSNLFLSPAVLTVMIFQDMQRLEALWFPAWKFTQALFYIYGPLAPLPSTSLLSWCILQAEITLPLSLCFAVWDKPASFSGREL